MADETDGARSFAVTDLSALRDELSEAQRHFVIMSDQKARHPYDIDSAGSTAAAMVRRGIAFRAVCVMTATGEQFNGYGLTPLGIALANLIKETENG